MNSKIMYLILFSMLSPLDGQGITEIVNTNGDFFLKITAESLVEIKLSRTWTISPNVPADQWMKKKYPGKEFQMPEKNLINLDSLFPQKKPELADETFLYNEFESPKDGFAKIGIGCDWWFEAACNGEVCHSTMKDGR